MKRRPGALWLAPAIVAFYFGWYAIRRMEALRVFVEPWGARPGPRAAVPEAVVTPDPDPARVDPPEPPAGVPYSPIPTLPRFLWPIAPQLVRPETREWRWIVVHHSAGTAGNAAEFDREHREERGWENGLGYHFVIGNGNGSPAGAVEVGGRWIAQLHGAHAGANATEYNQHGIGICVVGNFEETEMAGDVYASLRDLTIWLARRYGIPPDRILPHKDVRGEPTACPGKNFPLERLREDVRAALENPDPFFFSPK